MSKDRMQDDELAAVAALDRLQVAGGLGTGGGVVQGVYQATRAPKPVWTDKQRLACAELVIKHRAKIPKMAGGVQAVVWATKVMTDHDQRMRQERRKKALAASNGHERFKEALGLCFNPLSASLVVFGRVDPLNMPYRTNHTGPLLVRADYHTNETRNQLNKPANAGRFGRVAHVENAFVGVVFLDSCAKPEDTNVKNHGGPWLWFLKQRTIVFEKPVKSDWFPGMGKGAFDPLAVIAKAGRLMSPAEYHKHAGPIVNVPSLDPEAVYPTSRGNKWARD